MHNPSQILIYSYSSFLISLLDNLKLGDISARGFFKYQLSVQFLNRLTQGFQSGNVDKVHFEKGRQSNHLYLKQQIHFIQVYLTWSLSSNHALFVFNKKMRRHTSGCYQKEQSSCSRTHRR